MLKDKKILAIETSGELCSVSISFDYNKYDERNILMKHVHSEKLIPMINEIFSSNEISADQLFCVAISSGPGSFTGLRIGMTAAKGIAFASGIPIIPVPTFHALNHQISESSPSGITYAILNNANLEECYFGKYKIENNNTITICDAKLLNKSEIDNNIRGCDITFGNLKGVENIKFISSPRASSVAKWTYLFGEDLLTFDFDYLEPNYLKNFKVKQKK